MKQEVMDMLLSLSVSIKTNIKNVLDIYPIKPYLAIIHNYPATSGYKYNSASAVNISENIKHNYGIEMLQHYHALLVIELMKISIEKFDNLQLTDEIKTLCLINYSRIIKNISSNDVEYMDYGKDQFDKDLSASCMRLIPVGAQKLEVKKMGLGLLKIAPFKTIYCKLKMGLYPNVYDMHTDSNDKNLLTEFNEEGWRRFYALTANLMKINPSIKGLIGSSWFFDPALREISPRLRYLRDLVMDNGGISICLGTHDSDIKNATSTSKTRKELYDQGKYLPTEYMLLLTRDDLIEWSKKI